MQRLLPPLLFIIAALFAIKLHWFQPIAQVIPAPVNWAGLVPLIAGLGIAVWHARLFRRMGTSTQTFGEPDRLVTEGLFRFSRNPMYLGFVLALAGVSLLLGSVSPWLVTLAFALITDRWYIAYEERAMTARFGETYRAYQQRVRRWL